MTIQCIDDFLPDDTFNELKELCFSKDIKWNYSDHAVYEGDNTPLLAHLLYKDHKPESDLFDDFLDAIECIPNLNSLIRLRLSTKIKGSELYTTPYHIDIMDDNDVPLNVKICIIHLNTCDGYTQIKDNLSEPAKLLKSKANRAIFFPNTYYHRGSNTTNQNLRIVLNVVYQ